MTSKKLHTKRPVIAAVAVFVAVGVVVALARQSRPTSWGLPPDDAVKRMDRENNAWFTLSEAARLFGEQKAPDISLLAEWVLTEPEEFCIRGRVWKPKFVSPVPAEEAEIRSAIRAYIKSLEPALDKLCEASRKPWCLDPLEPRKVEELQKGHTYGSPLGADVMTAALINSAVTMSREGRGDGKPCEYVRSWLRLTQFLSPDQSMAHGPRQWTYAADVLRLAPAQQQDEMLAWLIEFRREWKPPVHTFIAFLRAMEHTPLPSFRNPAWFMARVREKRFLASNAGALIGLASMTMPEFQEHLRQHPEIRRWHSARLWEGAVFNSRVLSGTDGLTLLLAIEKYKRERGQYPDALEALAPEYVPQVPADAFNGKPFVYIKSADNYTLYSKGSGLHPNSLVDVTVFNAQAGYEF